MTYKSVHSHLGRIRGPASAYRCVDCGAPAHEWALSERAEAAGRVRYDNGLAYSNNPADYDAMCRRCHREADCNLYARRKPAPRQVERHPAIIGDGPIDPRTGLPPKKPVKPARGRPRAWR